jgi:hypothetical protein
MKTRHGFLGAALLVCCATLSHAGVVVGTGSQFYWTGVTGPTGTVASPTVPDNLALASGSTGFAIDVIAGGAYTVHQIDHLKDGAYGNSNSWIGQSGRSIDIYNNGSTIVNTGFAGVAFAAQTPIYNFSIGRDNLTDDFSGSYYTDRTDGAYYVQVTMAASVNASTPDSAWTTIGSVTMSGGDSHRHQFNLGAPVAATGLRIVAPHVENHAGVSGTCIDEIEVNTSYAAKVNHDTPVAYWRLGEAAGATTAVNSGTAGAALNGTYNPTTPGKVDHAGLVANDTNTAAHFSSTAAQYVQGAGLSTAGVGGANLFAADWTIESWFNRDSVTAGSAIFSNNVGQSGSPILTFGDQRSGTDGHALYFMNTGLSWGGAIGVDLSPSGDGHEYLGKDVYAVLTKTGANAAGQALVSMYVNVDGTWLTPVIDQTVSWAITPGDGYFLGRHYDGVGGAGLFLDGTIDDVALYNRALSQTEILDHYSSAVPEPSTLVLLVAGLLAYAWRKRR